MGSTVVEGWEGPLQYPCCQASDRSLCDEAVGPSPRDSRRRHGRGRSAFRAPTGASLPAAHARGCAAASARTSLWSRDRPTKGSKVPGRVTVIGDAAHPPPLRRLRGRHGHRGRLLPQATARSPGPPHPNRGDASDVHTHAQATVGLARKASPGGRAAHASRKFGSVRIETDSSLITVVAVPMNSRVSTSRHPAERRPTPGVREFARRSAITYGRRAVALAHSTHWGGTGGHRLGYATSASSQPRPPRQ